MGRLDGLLQAAQGVGPELGEQLADRLERLVVQRVEAAGSLAALGKEAGLLEHADVLADRLLGEGEGRRDPARGELGVLAEAQDLPAVRVGERPQHRIGCRGRRLLPLGQGSGRHALYVASGPERGAGAELPQLPPSMAQLGGMPYSGQTSDLPRQKIAADGRRAGGGEGGAMPWR